MDIKLAAAKLSEYPGVSFTDEALSKAIMDLNRHNGLLKRISSIARERAENYLYRVSQGVVASLTCPLRSYSKSPWRTSSLRGKNTANHRI